MNTTPRITPAAEVARLKPGISVDNDVATSLLSERVETIIDARRRFGRGQSKVVTFGAVAACSSKRWGWFVAAARRFSGNTTRKGLRALVAGPFPTKKAARAHARELNFTGRCLDHEDCVAVGNLDLARACFEAGCPSQVSETRSA